MKAKKVFSVVFDAAIALSLAAVACICGADAIQEAKSIKESK